MARAYTCCGYTANDLYDLFNRRYFRGRLPKVKVYWSFGKEAPSRIRKSTLGYTAFSPKKIGTEFKPCFIVLSPRIKTLPAIWVATLLHEMVHVEQRYLPPEQAHGRKFNKRMKQLALKGAFNGLW